MPDSVHAVDRATKRDLYAAPIGLAPGVSDGDPFDPRYSSSIDGRLRTLDVQLRERLTHDRQVQAQTPLSGLVRPTDSGSCPLLIAGYLLGPRRP